MSIGPLRIVHVIARLNVGGAAAQVLELAAGQRRRGHDVVVVAGTLEPGEASMEYLAEELSIPVVHLPALQRELSFRRDRAATAALYRLIRALRPDVVHTHAAKAGGTGRIAVLLAGVYRPKAIVHTFHGHVLRGYFGAYKEGVFRHVERVLARFTSALVAVSSEVRDELVALGVAPEDRFTVILYGFRFPAGAAVEARERLRAELGITDGTFVVGYAGRITPIKRPQDLVQALRGLVDREVDAALVVVGDGPDRPAVEDLATSLGVGERCRFVGYQRDIWEWYGVFDAFCLTSENEGTPVAAIESLAAGRPVVATRVGGVPAVVTDGETGFLVHPGDVDALAERLAKLSRDPALRETFGARGVELMHERYGTARMVEEHERLYERLLR